MTRYLILGGAVLLVVALALFYLPRAPLSLHAASPQDQRIGQLADLAERLCLAGADTTRTATVEVALSELRGSAAPSTHDVVVRGALDLPEAIRGVPDDHIRNCLAPYGEQIRKLATAQ